MLQAAIIGMGNWGRTLVQSVQAMNDAPIRFVAGCTATPAKAADWAAAQGIRILPDYDAVLADPAVQAVVLATPHRQHAEQVIAAARAGKHVFVEKPFTMSRESALAAAAACREHGRVLALGHNRRFQLPVLELKRLLAEGALGTLLHVEGQVSGPGVLGWTPGMWRADPEESPLGGMAAMGVHLLDMFINLGGPIAEVRVQSHARVLTNGLDDTTAMLCRFASGATGLFATLAAAPRYWRIALFGDQACAEVHGTQRLAFTPRQGEGWVKEFPAHDTERAELLAFAEACAGGPPFPLTPEEAVHGASAYEAMRGAAASGSTYRVA